MAVFAIYHIYAEETDIKFRNFCNDVNLNKNKYDRPAVTYECSIGRSEAELKGARGIIYALIFGIIYGFWSLSFLFG
jgi:hypothetical protein